MLNELVSLLAKDPNLTNALATAASVFVAGAAFVVSVVALYVAHATLKHQRRHNLLSVRPIPIVTVADYEDSLRIKIRNHGSGPLIVKNVQVADGTSVKESLVDWMPELPTGMAWTTFVGPVKSRSLLPGSEIALLELSGDSADAKFGRARDVVRSALSPLRVVVEYTDIYDSDFEPHTKGLSWFGRHQSHDSQG